MYLCDIPDVGNESQLKKCSVYIYVSIMSSSQSQTAVQYGSGELMGVVIVSIVTGQYIHIIWQHKLISSTFLIHNIFRPVTFVSGEQVSNLLGKLRWRVFCVIRY